MRKYQDLKELASFLSQSKFLSLNYSVEFSERGILIFPNDYPYIVSRALLEFILSRISLEVLSFYICTVKSKPALLIYSF